MAELLRLILELLVVVMLVVMILDNRRRIDQLERRRPTFLDEDDG